MAEKGFFSTPPFFLLNFNTNPFGYCKMGVARWRVRSETSARRKNPLLLLKGGAGGFRMMNSPDATERWFMLWNGILMLRH
jgi:hypothetical protein